MFESIGVLRFSIDPSVGHKVVVEADQGIADYYLSLLPKSIQANPQRFPAHVSVVRREVPVLNWGLRDGEAIRFHYSNQIEMDETYIWLPVICERLISIRTEMELPPMPPWRNSFHLTIGNMKTS